MSYKLAARPVLNTTMTVGEILELLSGKKIDRSPRYQRREVASKYWLQRIIQSLFDRTGVNTIHLRKMSNGSKYEYECLDGVQRLSAIFRFAFEGMPTTSSNKKMQISTPLGELSIPNVWEDMGPEPRQRFLESEVQVAIYDESMTDDEASTKFYELNNGNDLKDQEFRNSITGFLSRFVRCTVEPDEKDIEENEFKQHSLFVTLNGKNERRQMEEIFARMVFWEYHHSSKISNNFNAVANKSKAITDVYLNSMKLRYNDGGFLTSIVPVVRKRLSTIEEMYNECPSRMKSSVYGSSRSLSVYGFLLYLERENYSINSAKKMDFYHLYNEVFYKLYNDKETLYDGKQESRKSVTYKGLCGLWLTDQIEERYRILMNELLKKVGTMFDENEPCLFKLDPVRFFSNSDVVKKWNEQGKKCASTGESLKLDDAVGGHMMAWSRGGTTTYDNLVVIHKNVNNEMGNMHWDEYLEYKNEEDLKKVA